MEPIETVLYKPLDLKNQKVVEFLEGKIEFYADYVKFNYNFFSEEPVNSEDKGLGEESIERNYTCAFLKRNIASIELEWLTKPELWIVCVQVSGMANDARFYYRSEAQARGVFAKFLKYVESI